MLECLSSQHPPLFVKHSFVSMLELRHTAGSVVSLKPEQMALRTALLSNFPVKKNVISSDRWFYSIKQRLPDKKTNLDIVCR